MNQWFCGSVTGRGVPKTLHEPSEGKEIWESPSSFWLCGSWQQQQLITFADGPVRVIIVGTCLEDKDTLLDRLRQSTTAKDYSLLMRLPGNYNMVISEENSTYVSALFKNGNGRIYAKVVNSDDTTILFPDSKSAPRFPCK